MIAFVRKKLPLLISKHISQPVRSSPVLFSLSLQFSSAVSSVSDRLSEILRHDYEFSPELASRVASESTRRKNPENATSILSFLKESGCSNAQLMKLLKCRPDVLSASLEGDTGIKPKVKILQDVGLSLGDIWKISSSNPGILKLNLKNNIFPSLVVLKGVLGSNSEVAKVISRSPWLLTANLENSLVPNVDFLKSCGISMDRILIILINFPACFMAKPEVIRESSEKAEEMGLKASSKNFIYAIPAIASMSKQTFELKLQGLRDLGFSNEDILTMFRKAPNFISVSNEKIMKITELLLGTGKYNISSIVNCPRSFGMSIPNKCIPRLQILEALENRNLIKEWPGLGVVCRLSDDMFSKQFIRPYAHIICDVPISGKKA